MDGKLKGMKETVLYIVRSFVDGKVEKQWDVWHSKQHVPEVLKQPGFLGASKYRDARSNGEYWTLYELESLEAFEKYDKGQEAKRLRADHHARYGGSTRTERFVLVKTFDKRKAAGPGE